MNKIDIIINEVFPAGSHSVRWNGNHFPSGIYFCQLQAGSTIKVNKLVLIKKKDSRYEKNNVYRGNHQPNVALGPANVPRQTQSGIHWWNWYISCSWWRLSFKKIMA